MPITPWRIRPWASADTPSLRAMYNTTWTTTYGATLGPDMLQSLLALLDPPDLSAILPGEDGRTTIAEAGPPFARQIMGSIIAAERGQTAYVWAMYVAPDHQRQGIGSALLRQGTSWLSTAALVEVRVIRSSIGALGFYKSYGFQEAGTEDAQMQGRILPTVIMTVPRADLNRCLA
jgi:ribosomal protein S18 acetylase RimI-like enzyme